MIKITVEQTITETFKETVNMETRREPTEILDEPSSSLYSGGKKERKYIIESAPQEVTKTRERRVTLLEQEIVNDGDFNLKAVIATVNGIDARSL